MLGIPTKELKTTLANADRALAEAERTLQHARSAIVTHEAIADDLKAITAALRKIVGG